MTDALGLAEKVNKFNQQALKHLESQTLNPFSGRFSRSPSPRPRFGKDEYGKPKAGSLTDLRGQKAFNHISREILDLCNLIHDVGSRKRERGEYECDEEEDDGQIIMTFGELFAIYSKISDKVVGLLIAAKKRGFVYFEPEILFQRRDDDVLIALMKPIEEIRSIIDRQLSASPSPAATTTPYFNDKEEQPESNKSSEQPDEAKSNQSCADPSVNEPQTQPNTELPTVKEELVPPCLPVMDDTPGKSSDKTAACPSETDPSSRKGSVCSPPTEHTPSTLETSGENKESIILPNAEPFSNIKSEELTPNPITSEPPRDSVEDSPSSASVVEPSTNKDESQSIPMTESSTNNEEQILSTPEPSSNKDELLSIPVTESSTNNEEQILSTPEPSSNKDDSQSTPVTESSTNNEDQTISTPEPSSNKGEETMLYPSVTAPSSDKGEQTLS